ncbi:MAG: response regulator [Pseudomonadota bacterium]
MTETKSTVFVVDDDDDIRSSLARALDKRGYHVETYGSATSFLDSYDPARPGCLILDYGMPEMNGLELQERLTGLRSRIPIIFITGHGGIPESVQAMKGGALDFIEKPFKQDVLINRINEALENDMVARAEAEKTAAVWKQFESLTAREKEIFHLMATDPARSSSKEIGRKLDISPRTADHHRARILEKMDSGSVAELIDVALTCKLFDTVQTDAT